MRREKHTESERAFRDSAVSGEFIDFGGERHYVIHNVDRMAPFFMSMISSSDHWLFASSTGGLTAGRVSPETALFPYVTVDKIHESTPHTGSKTIIRIAGSDSNANWEPFNKEHDGRYSLTRNLYKNVLGSSISFEEINHDLKLAFRYSWATSDEFGFVRRCELENLSGKPVTLEIVDGLQNVLPAGTPSYTQANSSNLVDAYKWTELAEQSGLALFTLYSAISDRAEPSESLRANTVFSLGLDDPTILISSEQLDLFRRGEQICPENHKRGIRGAFLLGHTIKLPTGSSKAWQIVADIERTQAQVANLRRQLSDPGKLESDIAASIQRGADKLARIVAAADGFQVAAEENVTAHHYANVLFNVLRGGIFDDQYRISVADLKKTIWHFNHSAFERNRTLLEELPEGLDIRSLLTTAKASGDPQLERLCFEYLPITFGRRHGDPSRPWNRFSIRTKDENGDPLLSYEGNWRDIFQNWEALALSFPEFIENIIAKFVNASTIDGYNPYRITKQGIDWEVEDPEDPWSYIGYWGDHQIIYLLKLLEMSEHFHPARLSELLHKPIFSYANVPYRIKPFYVILDNPKDTVEYDHALSARISDRVDDIGADGKLLLDDKDEVYRVNLLEKLLVPLLSKLGNLVLDGGIWMNTQRPEWNDANNALVGQGLSMVTLFYMRRYVQFMKDLLAEQTGDFEISTEVSRWIRQTVAIFNEFIPELNEGPVSARKRFALLKKLGEAASAYRMSVYAHESFSGQDSQPLAVVRQLLDGAQAIIDHSIAANLRADGLFHAYNLLDAEHGEARLEHLYLMLEGQVAALSAGTIAPRDAADMLRALFDSDVYRPDQKSFMLYPDRKLAGFIEKNRIPPEKVEGIGSLKSMLESGDTRIVLRDAEGTIRFNADFRNISDLSARIDMLTSTCGKDLRDDRASIEALYEQVFHHRAFTGRSGGMFGFEGLGCIYWHMVSKLLLAVQENFFSALDDTAEQSVITALGEVYYRVRDGIGFNKTPAEYGAFPVDPYSHTPKHAGAQQPGMTGQVKEEVLTRFGELGIRIKSGAVRFDTRLLRASELETPQSTFRFLDVDEKWQQLSLPARSLAFTWCQVPIVYTLADGGGNRLTLTFGDGTTAVMPDSSIDAELSAQLFLRSGKLRRIDVTLEKSSLLSV